MLRTKHSETLPWTTTQKDDDLTDVACLLLMPLPFVGWRHLLFNHFCSGRGRRETVPVWIPANPRFALFPDQTPLEIRKNNKTVVQPDQGST